MSKTTIPGYSWVNIGVTFVAIASAAIAWGATIAFFPYYLNLYSYNWIQAGMILVISALPMMFTGPLAEKLLHKLGSNNAAKKMFIIGMAIMAIMQFITPYAPLLGGIAGYVALMAVRFIFGIGLFLIMPAFPRVIIPWSGFESAPTMVALGTVCIMIGFFVALLFLPAIYVFVWNLSLVNTLLTVGALLVTALVLFAIFVKERKE